MNFTNKIMAFSISTLLFFGLMSFTSTSPVTGDEYTIDNPPGEIAFYAYNNRYEANGKFDRWQFTSIDVPNGELEKASFEVEIDMSSVSEQSDKLANHLKQSDFFDVENFPKTTISVSGIQKTGDNSYSSTAKVSILGVEADVPINFQVTSESPLTIEAKTIIQRDVFVIGRPLDQFAHIINDVEVTIKTVIPIEKNDD